MSETSKREELIEEARRAIHAAIPGSGDYEDWIEATPRGLDLLGDVARAAFAVFEQAHTPSDDERADLDDLEAMIEGAYDLRHVPVYPVRAMIRELRFRRTVQGEPGRRAEWEAEQDTEEPDRWERL